MRGRSCLVPLCPHGLLSPEGPIGKLRERPRDKSMMMVLCMWVVPQLTGHSCPLFTSVPHSSPGLEGHRCQGLPVTSEKTKAQRGFWFQVSPLESEPPAAEWHLPGLRMWLTGPIKDNEVLPGECLSDGGCWACWTLGHLFLGLGYSSPEAASMDSLHRTLSS